VVKSRTLKNCLFADSSLIEQAFEFWKRSNKALFGVGSLNDRQTVLVKAGVVDEKETEMIKNGRST